MTELEEIADNARKCADFYEKSPGAVDHRAIIDIYRAIARLADAVRDK